MEIDKIIINFRKKKGGTQMKKNPKVLTEGKKVVPKLKRVTSKAIRDVKKTYPK